MYSSVFSRVKCFRFTLPFAEVISPVQYPVGGSVRAECQWASQLSDTGAWVFIISPLVPEIEIVPISRDCTLILSYFSILTFLCFFFSPVTVIVVSQSCVKWRLMLNFVLQQSIKDWSLMVQREWRDQWRNDLRTFSTVSLVSFVQPNADCVLKVHFCGQHLMSIKYQ